MGFSTPLGLFSVLWAIAAALHHLEAQPLAGLPIYPFVVMLLVFPDRVWALATFALAHGALLTIDLPSAANHSVLGVLVNGAILLACAHVTWQGGDAAARPLRLWAALRGPMRATVAVVYFFAIFHKLNSSFFDPEVSCATDQVAKMFRLHGLEALEPELSALAPSILLTVAAELAIPVLLLWPRWAHVGAVVGLVFHTGLAWARFFDFATVIFALYLFFFSWESIQARIKAIPAWAPGCLVAALVALSATSFYAYGLRRGPVLIRGDEASVTADTLICVFWMLIVWPILLPLFARADEWLGDRRWSSVRLAWVVPAIALLNGATPYLGLKTVANYSMFSNLRTEGGQTNHLLVPVGRFALAGYQEDLARVSYLKRVPPKRWPWWVRLAGGERWVRRNSRWLQDMPGARVPFAELRRTIQLWQAIGFTGVSVEYERGGEAHQVPDAFADPHLMGPMPAWERKLMAFRAVEDDGLESSCRW